ncbi:MAG: hypothetical protein R3C56_39400 [Pirellulaceae bacterium]
MVIIPISLIQIVLALSAQLTTEEFIQPPLLDPAIIDYHDANLLCE